jgi:hypothetical protein
VLFALGYRGKTEEALTRGASKGAHRATGDAPRVASREQSGTW